MTRKIELEMINAIENNTNWSKDNTSVIHLNDEKSTTEVYLHGNKIAEVDEDSMTIFDGGYQSKTTKSRLNVLCRQYCIDGEGVYQKNFQWYVRKFVGCVNGKNIFKNEDFISGYTFAWGVSPLFFYI